MPAVLVLQRGGVMGVVDVFVAELAEAEDAAACHSVAEKAIAALREQEEASVPEMVARIRNLMTVGSP